MTVFELLFRATNGTLLNAATVLGGGVLGTIIGSRLSERMQDTFFVAIGLLMLLIGMASALDPRANALVLLGSLLVGGLIGEALNIEQRLNRLGDWLQRRLAREGSTFSEGFVTASLVFCVGPLSILGALSNGLNGDISDLALKAVLDGISAMAFAAMLGWGVMAAVGTILMYQGAISLGAHALKPLVDANPASLVALNAVGGLILVAIGIKLLKLREIRVASFLPALVVAPLLVAFINHWQLLVPRSLLP